MDLAVGHRDEERLVDVRTDATTRQRRFGHQVESSPNLIAVDGELGHRRSADDLVLRPPIQAAAQVISRETRS